MLVRNDIYSAELVMYGCESWTVKKAERQRIDAFGLWLWRRLLRVPWTARRSNQSLLKDISPGCLLGASVRNSTRGKGHEEGGSAYAKAGSCLRSPPGNSQASTPKARVCLLYCFVLSPTPLTLRGAVPHHLSLKRS